MSANIAFVLTDNGGPNARIYKTEDGGDNWTLEFQSPIANTFYDCFAFWNPLRAVAIPDAEDGRFDVIRMTDGHTWENIGDNFPPGQQVYALSYVPTGGGHDPARTHGLDQAVFAAGPSGAAWSRDEGDTWESVAGAGTGYFGVEFASHRRGWLVGRDGAVTRIDM